MSARDSPSMTLRAATSLLRLLAHGSAGLLAAWRADQTEYMATWQCWGAMECFHAPSVEHARGKQPFQEPVGNWFLVEVRLFIGQFEGREEQAWYG